MLKSQGLIVQPDKLGIRHEPNRDELFGCGFVNLSGIDIRDKEAAGLDVEDDAEELFLQAWFSSEPEKCAEVHMIFALHRLDANERISKYAVKLLSRMYWRSDRIAAFLSQFSRNSQIIGELLAQLTRHKVYAWHLAKCLGSVAVIAQPEEFRVIPEQWLSDTRLHWYQRVAAAYSLALDPVSNNFLFVAYQDEDQAIVRKSLLVASVVSATTDTRRASIIRAGLRDTNSDIVATAVWLFLQYPNCGIAIDEFANATLHNQMMPEFANSLTPGVNYISTGLQRYFSVRIPTDLDMRAYLGSAHDAAAAHLRRAIAQVGTDPDGFITSIDNFNQTLAIVVCRNLPNNPGIPEDQYANMLNHLKSHSTLQAMASHFLDCHELRSACRGPHAWSVRDQNWSVSISHTDKERAIGGLSVAYQHVVDLAAAI